MYKEIKLLLKYDLIMIWQFSSQLFSFYSIVLKRQNLRIFNLNSTRRSGARRLFQALVASVLNPHKESFFAGMESNTNSGDQFKIEGSALNRSSICFAQIFANKQEGMAKRVVVVRYPGSGNLRTNSLTPTLLVKHFDSWCIRKVFVNAKRLWFLNYLLAK